MQVSIRIELQKIVKSLLVVSVTAFHFAVMPWSLRADRLVLDMKSAAQSIQRVRPACLLGMREFSAVVRLDHVRSISEIADRTLHKVHRRVAAGLLLFSFSVLRYPWRLSPFVNLGVVALF